MSDQSIPSFPIIFSAPMILALLDGRKTMTRRLAEKPTRTTLVHDGDAPLRLTVPSPWQHVQPGDRLWVRENLQRFDREPATAQHVATLTGVVAPPGIERHPNGAALWKWSKRALPSIHMPRWASRLTLVVTATKIERLQEISEDDAIAEGVYTGNDGDLGPLDISARALFSDLWAKLHGGEDAVLSNPEVVAITFTVHKQNIDTLPKADAPLRAREALGSPGQDSIVT